jgi:hypothetical protein
MSRLKDLYGLHFLRIELGLAALATGAFIYWSENCGGAASIAALIGGRRESLYGAFASLAGSLLGFVLATVSIVIGLVSSPRLRVVRESPHYGTLWKVFTSATRFFALATCILLGALIFDEEPAMGKSVHLWWLYACTFLVVASSLRLGRCIWVLEQVVSIIQSEGGRDRQQAK